MLRLAFGQVQSDSKENFGTVATLAKEPKFSRRNCKCTQNTHSQTAAHLKKAPHMMRVTLPFLLCYMFYYFFRGLHRQAQSQRFRPEVNLEQAQSYNTPYKKLCKLIELVFLVKKKRFPHYTILFI